MNAAPSPETVLIRALHRALWSALVPRADGSRHHMNCINANVNAIWRPCSKKCDLATGALLLAQDYEDRMPALAHAARQLELVMEATG